MKQGRLEVVEGASPVRITTRSAVSELSALIEAAEARLRELVRARAMLVGDDGGSLGAFQSERAGSGPEARVAPDELISRERAGRALAEARIDELKSALRRANAAIEALMVDPHDGLA